MAKPVLVEDSSELTNPCHGVIRQCLLIPRTSLSKLDGDLNHSAAVTSIREK